jgi:hypothetical protein
MRGRRNDLTGRKFAFLTVVGFSHRDKGNNAMWMCRCSCGAMKTIRGNHLSSGEIFSCGCKRNELNGAAHATHGQGRKTSTGEYNSWIGMKDRCHNPNRSDYKDYGGRGIRVCKKWLNSFENFFADMGPRPSAKHSIDRIRVNGDYEPSNCRWATKMEQVQNQRAKKRRNG